MNWQMIVGGTTIVVFVITWIATMAIASGMTLKEFVTGLGVIVFVVTGVVLFAKGLSDYLHGG